jgi:hypothetical protein
LHYLKHNRNFGNVYSEIMETKTTLFIALYFMCCLFLLPQKGMAQNNAPEITSLYAWADTANHQLVLYYDVTDTEGDDLEIEFSATANDTNYWVNTAGATGDVGFPITPGFGKTITWDYGQVLADSLLTYKVRLVADDHGTIDIQHIVDQVDTMNLYNDLQWLQGVRDHNAGLQHLEDVRDSILHRFERYGLEISEQPFTFSSYNGLNISGRIRGTEDEAITFINDAHYDGVAGAPAADDNGSGVVAFLEAARILSQYQYNHSIRFIGFDLEESGLIGSYHYVNNGGIEPWEQIGGVLNFEMIGYYSDKDSTQIFPNGFDFVFPAAYDSMVAANWKGNFLANIANDSSSWLKNQFDSCAKAFVPELRVISIQTPGNGQATPDLRRSDHAPFWDQGYQALMLTDAAEFRNANYHTPTDVMDSLDFWFMGNSCKATIATLCVLAEIRHSAVAHAGISTALPVNIEAINRSSKLNFIAWPNPAENLLQIKFTGSSPLKAYNLQITDGLGKMVYKRINILSDHLTIAISDWRPGPYQIVGDHGNYTSSQTIIIK